MEAAVARWEATGDHLHLPVYNKHLPSKSNNPTHCSSLQSALLLPLAATNWHSRALILAPPMSLTMIDGSVWLMIMKSSVRSLLHITIYSIVWSFLNVCLKWRWHWLIACVQLCQIEDTLFVIDTFAQLCQIPQGILFAIAIHFMQSELSNTTRHFNLALMLIWLPA